MKKVLLYSHEELTEIAKKVVRSEKASLKHWELEISDREWPKLHVTYFHMDDGQGLHLTIVPLEGPK